MVPPSDLACDNCLYLEKGETALFPNRQPRHLGSMVQSQGRAVLGLPVSIPHFPLIRGRQLTSNSEPWGGGVLLQCLECSTFRGRTKTLGSWDFERRNSSLIDSTFVLGSSLWFCYFQHQSYLPVSSSGRGNYHPRLCVLQWTLAIVKSLFLILQIKEVVSEGVSDLSMSTHLANGEAGTHGSSFPAPSSYHSNHPALRGNQ